MYLAANTRADVSFAVKCQGLPTDLSTRMLWQSSAYYAIWWTPRIWAWYCVPIEISSYHSM